jgi:hypothetical protein
MIRRGDKDLRKKKKKVFGIGDFWRRRRRDEN